MSEPGATSEQIQRAISEAAQRIHEADQATHADALDDFDAADKCALNHYPGHEMYAAERYLRCLCILALSEFRKARGVVVPNETDRILTGEDEK